MSFETALRSRLKADGAVTDLTGTRIDWAKRPQGSAYPAVVMQVIYDDRAQHMTGFQRLRATQVQIDCFALDAPTKVALREAVIAALADSGLFYGVRFGRVVGLTVRDLSTQTETQFVHRDSIDCTFWHKLET